MKKALSLVGIILLVAVTVACGSPTVAPPTEAPTTATQAAQAPTAALQPESPANITNILWQWEELVETEPAGQSVVPDPENYTLAFQLDGQFVVKADCNAGSGMYTLEGNSVSLAVGPLTMATCPPETLHDTYLQLLSQVDSYAVQGGRLELILADDAGHMVFGNAGPAGTATDGVGIDPASVTLDTGNLPYSYQPNLVPATPYDESQPPGPVGLPEHIQVNFGVTNWADKQPGDPVIYIVPVEAYQQLWESNNNSAVSNALEQLQSLLEQRPIPVPPFGLPALPFEEVGTGVNDLAVQGKYLDFDAGRGVRFVGRFAQDANPVTNLGLRYVFQGFSNDGRYLVTFFYPVTTGALPSPEDVTAAEQERVASDLESYLEEKGAELNALSPSRWDPDLATLDAVIASLQFQTVAGAGSPDRILDTTWQWAGLTETQPAGQSVVPDPENYTIVFRRDGQFEVRADCSTGSGTYILEDKRLTLELGPMTPDTGSAASCGEESLHDQYLQLLGQVSGYRWEDGWLVLILGDETGRMIFSHGGPAE